MIGREIKKILLFAGISFVAVSFACKTSNQTGDNSSATPNATPIVTAGNIEVVPRPQKIVDMMKQRGTQDEAKPVLKVISPSDGDEISSSTVKISLSVTGGVEEGKDSNGMGNHVHVILDNQPYAAFYNWDESFELRNVKDGSHTLRMFVSRPWHESYKNQEAFAVLKFVVKQGDADPAKPTTDDKGNTLADPSAEGVSVEPSISGSVDYAKPLLTYSRPKGDYKGEDADPIMLDFWLSNVSLVADGGEYRVRCTIDDGEPIILEKWEAIWLRGWKEGKNSVKLELIDDKGSVIENDGYNGTVREINVSK